LATAAAARLPNQVIVRNDQYEFERFDCFLPNEGQNCLHYGKLRLVANLRRVDHSPSRHSDRFLAVGEVTQSDRLVVELVQRPDTSPEIMIKWPSRPTFTDPAKLTATVAAIVRVLGSAQIELAARRAAGL
jgi:hypothetical protein